MRRDDPGGNGAPGSIWLVRLGLARDRGRGMPRFFSLTESRPIARHRAMRCAQYRAGFSLVRNPVAALSQAQESEAHLLGRVP